MPPKISFQNEFEDYSPNTANNILNATKDGVSDILFQKIKNFKEEKLKELTTILKLDIFNNDTVYSGSAGLAFYYIMYPSNKEETMQYMELALKYLNLKELKGRHISFLCGDAGPLAIATVISHKMNTNRPSNLPEYQALAQSLINLGSLLDDSPDEILYGKAGYLYALLFVNKYAAENVIPPNHIEKVVNAIINSGKQLAIHMKSEPPLMWQWHDKIYFGAAHGMAGILYMLLQARNYVNITDLRNYIKLTIDWLLGQRFVSGNFPSSLGSSNGDKLVQWCHGAPGFVPLCLLAHEVYEDDKYLKLALKCGKLVWERGLTTKGYSICHGVSGNAYTFLQLYQATKTKREIHLYRACCFMEWCAVERPDTEMHRPDRPASLFEGLVGRLYLAEDINRPMEAKFPGFCL